MGSNRLGACLSNWFGRLFSAFLWLLFLDDELERLTTATLGCFFTGSATVVAVRQQGTAILSGCNSILGCE